MAPEPKLFAVLAGGGTGGHVVPAIAVARALVERGHAPDTLLFVGAARGIERDLVPAAGFAVTLLPGRGIARRLTSDNVGAVGGLVAAVARCVVLFARRRPRVVISVGGFASVAGVVAAMVWRIPVVVAEQNAVPGLANRLAARFAAASAVSFPGTALPRSVVTGNPVRSEMVAVRRDPATRRQARADLGLPGDARRVVVVAGGSLGASRLNDAVAELVVSWADRADMAVHHVVGWREWDGDTGPASPAAVGGAVPASDRGGLFYRRVPFEADMATVYAAADLAVHRAGASTVAELAAAGMPAVLVPLPGAPGDHQRINASRLEAAGAAVVVADADLDGARLGTVVDDLLGTPDRLEEMGAAASGLAFPRAAADVAALAERHARA